MRPELGQMTPGVRAQCCPVGRTRRPGRMSCRKRDCGVMATTENRSVRGAGPTASSSSVRVLFGAPLAFRAAVHIGDDGRIWLVTSPPFLADASSPLFPESAVRAHEAQLYRETIFRFCQYTINKPFLELWEFDVRTWRRAMLAARFGAVDGELLLEVTRSRDNEPTRTLM